MNVDEGPMMPITMSISMPYRHPPPFLRTGIPDEEGRNPASQLSIAALL